MKILVTGGNGLVGSALKRLSDTNDKDTFLFKDGKSDLDFRDYRQVRHLFDRFRPDYVIHTAAKVGGVGGNAAHHAEYYLDNILMNTNLIHTSYQSKVKKFIGFSSVCVFPDGIGTLTEDNMHKGEPSPFNFAYAYAKRMIDVQIQAYKAQHNIENYSSVILTNTFGENDMYSIEHGHVIPSLMHKLFIAKRDNLPFEVWGDGSAIREFIYAGDVANIVMGLLALESIPQRIIVSSKEQYLIKDIVEKLVKVSGFTGEVKYDITKPNGQPSRPTDISLLANTLKVDYTNIDEALKVSWDWFVQNYPNVRQ